MTLDYKLCKELKDAGFPQMIWEDVKFYHEYKGNHHEDMVCLPCKIGLGNNEPLNWGEMIKIPTLSELIEACGDDFHDLEYQKGNWRKGEWCAGSKSKISVFGKTPEEAVANLYIALKK